MFTLVDQSGKFCRQCGDVVLNNPTFLLGQIGCGDIKSKKRFTCDDECVDISAVGSHTRPPFCDRVGGRAFQEAVDSEA